MNTYPKEYCGLFGIQSDPEAASKTCAGLIQLQHRGEESAGIVAQSGGTLVCHKGMGLVTHVLTQDALAKLAGESAIGHVRYSTQGASSIENAQPLLADTYLGPVAVAHNGNITNATELREKLAKKGVAFRTSSDSEIILCLITGSRAQNIEESLREVLPLLEGAYSLLILTRDKLIGVRDPFGFRPLCLGTVGGNFALSSESCAFGVFDNAEAVREIEAGEMVVLEAGRPPRSEQLFPNHAKRAFCVFEYVYFARPDSTIGGLSVYLARVNMGRMLAREQPAEADIVVPVPDSGNCGALGYSRESQIPFDCGFVRSHYWGRAFISPSPADRALRARMKNSVIKEVVRGRRVVVVDDSLVRGTTIRSRVAALKGAGAKEVHVRINCPPHRFACVYGIDFPDPSKLPAARYSIENICQQIGADSLGYLSEEGMLNATGKPRSAFCRACFNGQYPSPFDAARYEEAQRLSAK